MQALEGGESLLLFASMIPHATVVTVLRATLLLAAVLPPSLEGAIVAATHRAFSGIGGNQIDVWYGGRVSRLRGGGERETFMKPMPVGLEESSLDDVARRYYDRTAMAPTTKLLSLLREEAGGATINVNTMDAAHRVLLMRREALSSKDSVRVTIRFEPCAGELSPSRESKVAVVGSWSDWLQVLTLHP